MANIRICAFGDSAMKGTVLESTMPLKYSLPEETFTDKAASALGIQIDNFARFGSTVNVGEKIVARHMAQIPRYDYTLLKFGGNDCDFNWEEVGKDPRWIHEPFTPLTEFSLVYKRIIDQVREAGSTPVILSLVPVDPQHFYAHVTRSFGALGRSNVIEWLGGSPSFIGEWHEMYNLQVLGIAAKNDVPVIDITSPFFKRPGFARLLCKDGIHPNAEGQKIMANALADGLRNIIGDALQGLGGVQLAFC